MTSSMSHSVESTLAVESAACPGVVLTINRMSFGRRLELTRQVRELGRKLEFLEASTEFGEKAEAAILSSEIDCLYLRWGLVEIAGLSLDGVPATSETLIASGPEPLSLEILNAIKNECGLNEAERKNS